MTSRVVASERVFKTAWFAKAARKSHIADAELCTAMRQVMLGQADDLGGGVYKKRLGRNLYRSIVLAKGRHYWVYIFLFAKKDQDNISHEELAYYRKVAALYAVKTKEEIAREVQLGELTEICHDQEAEV